MHWHAVIRKVFVTEHGVVIEVASICKGIRLLDGRRIFIRGATRVPEAGMLLFGGPYGGVRIADHAYEIDGGTALVERDAPTTPPRVDVCT